MALRFASKDLTTREISSHLSLYLSKSSLLTDLNLKEICKWKRKYSFNQKISFIFHLTGSLMSNKNNINKGEFVYEFQPRIFQMNWNTECKASKRYCVYTVCLILEWLITTGSAWPITAQEVSSLWPIESVLNSPLLAHYPIRTEIQTFKMITRSSIR